MRHRERLHAIEWVALILQLLPWIAAAGGVAALVAWWLVPSDVQ